MDESRNISDQRPDSQLSSTPVSRRSFLGAASLGVAGLGAASAATLLAGVPASRVAQSSSTSATASGEVFFDLLRTPDSITAYERLSDPVPLSRSGSQWQGKGIGVESSADATQLALRVHAPSMAIRYIHVRWTMKVAAIPHVLGDHWERSYGDLGWRSIVSERVMPWYFATWDGRSCNTYGVKTGAGSLCFWQLDPDGVSLWLNLSNGGSGVKLGQRVLEAATVVTRKGNPGEEPTSAIRAFCRQMCSQPSRPSQPVYGTNDWYYAYGKNTAEQILNDTDFIANLSVNNAIRPFSVIDMGWSVGAPKFPSMPQLANQIRERRARPGIWIRPLEAPANTDRGLLISDRRFENSADASQLAYDPTVPEALERVLAKVKQVVDWGYELVKHDFSTYDLLGRWGSGMGAEPTISSWSLHDQSRTNAEIIRNFYQQIRATCKPETLILGCNTMGHLGQSIFDIQRTGDDTSGRIWERTRRMGINTLAFRLPQHETFFVQDADCVGISADVPWELNRQWLDLLAHSGTAVLISPGEGSRIPEHAEAIKRAFKLAASGGDGARPASPVQESTPQTWITGLAGQSKESDRKLHYDWYGEGGAFPFTV
ncbi:alpha-amylase family protein [Acidicapsa ligni]|uniref:hypothetical protein n=1 Tax=Acidicapsa ligni TaxID=542300 RepID=UPI0021E0F65D|nr:hypothetical protein [Acidicapsa ligni]